MDVPQVVLSGCRGDAMIAYTCSNCEEDRCVRLCSWVVSWAPGDGLAWFRSREVGGEP
jgi:hypothetical protein